MTRIWRSDCWNKIAIKSQRAGWIFPSAIICWSLLWGSVTFSLSDGQVAFASSGEHIFIELKFGLKLRNHQFPCFLSSLSVDTSFLPFYRVLTCLFSSSLIRKTSWTGSRASLGFSGCHCVHGGGFLQNINGEVIRCVDRETEDKRLVRPVMSTRLRGPKTCLNYVTELSAHLLLSSLLPGRLYKSNWCLAAGQDPLLESLFNKSFVWCCRDALGSLV